MEQLEMNVDNTDAFLLANGYGKLQGMGQKLEARFGRLMVKQAKAEGTFKEYKYRFPRSTDIYSNNKPLSEDEVSSAVFVVREAVANGLTSNSLAKAAGITLTAASKRIQRQVKNGHLRKFGSIYKPTGGTSYIYVMTDTGEKLLKESEE